MTINGLFKNLKNNRTEHTTIYVLRTGSEMIPSCRQSTASFVNRLSNRRRKSSSLSLNTHVIHQILLVNDNSEKIQHQHIG